MLSILFASIAEAVISYTLDKLDPAETLKSWLKRDPVTLAFQKSLARTYSAFARQYPDYTASLFDHTFLTGKAVPELSKLLTRNQHPDPALLVLAWGEALGTDMVFSRPATKPASDFLLWLEAELKGEPALQPLFDSRTLDSIEARIENLTKEIQRGLLAALSAADGYKNHSGDFISLNEYYIPPDGVFQRVRVDEFVGRDWLSAKVDAFLNDPQRKSGAFLLIGDAGVGKTSFMAHLVKERRYIHIFAEQAPGQAMLQRALQSLGSQLVTRYQIDPYKDRDTLTQLAIFPDFLERLLRLAAGTLTNGEKIVIVCDALDEAGTFSDHFVLGLPKELPDGVYFILSQRPVNVKLPNFEPVIERLEAQGESNLQDIESYLSAVAKRPEMAGQIRSKQYSEYFFIQTLKEKSQGVWMYLHYIIKEIESGARAPLDLANLPTGLVGYYAEYWDAWRTGKRGKGEDVWDELYAPLLTMLAATQEAITVENLIQWAGVTVTPQTVTRLLTEHWRAFITEKEVNGEKAYAPYHLSFKDFITGRVDKDKLPPAQTNLIKDLAAQTVDAHKHIVDVLEKECNGEWEKLVEQDYPRLHLCTHFACIEDYETLRILLTEGDEKIKWAEARYKKEETYAGYLSDLVHVWEYSERKKNYVLAIRCMLIENSIHSLASNIPPELLVQLAKGGFWSYARSLSTIRENSNFNAQVEGLRLIIPSLPQSLLQNALVAVREIKSETLRSISFTTLTSYLTDELKPQALATACEIKDEGHRARALVNLAPYLTNELKPQVFAAACEIKNEAHHARVLADLAPHLTDDLKSRALAIAREIKNEVHRVRVLSALAPHLADGLKLQALVVAHEIKDEKLYARVLEAFAPYLIEELHPDILAAAREIKNELYRARILAALIPILNEELKKQALSIAQEIKSETYKVNALIALTPYLNNELKAQSLHQALAAAHEIKNQTAKAIALTALAPYLNDELKKQALYEALTAAREITNKTSQSSALTALAPYLNDELKKQVLYEALAAVREITYDGDYTHALINLAPYLAQELKQQALDIVGEIRSKSNRTRIFAALTSHLADDQKLRAIQDALAVAREINNEFPRARARALVALSPYLNNEELMKQALDAALEIKSEYDRAHALSALALHLTDELKTDVLQKALAAAREINDAAAHASVLTVLIPFLTDEKKILALRDALASALKIKNEADRANALVALAPSLTDELMRQTLASISEIQTQSSRARALAALAPYATDELKPQVLAAVYEISPESKQTESYRTRALAVLTPEFTVEIKTQTPQDAFAVTRDIKGELERADALVTLLPDLPQQLRQQALWEALITARDIKNETDRARVLLALTPYLTDQLKPRALQYAVATTRKIKDESQRARTLTNLAPYLTDQLKLQVLDAVYEIKIEQSRAYALTELAPHLSEHLKLQALQDALATARQLKSLPGRARVLAHLASQLEYPLKLQVLQEVLYIPTDDSLSETLSVWKEVEFEGLENRIVPFVKTRSQHNRSNGLKALGKFVPVLTHFSGKVISHELLRTVTDVTRWWP